MDEILISKRELLELTGISYGQLYRWKRKGLIPEDWFVKKSSYTGQETFFPKTRILTRVDRIKSMKDDISLNDLADVFSPDVRQISLRPQELIDQGIITQASIQLYLKDKGDLEQIGFCGIVAVYLTDRYLQRGDISLDEASQLIDLVEESLITGNEDKKDGIGQSGLLVFFRKLGVFCCFIAAQASQVKLDRQSRLIEQIQVDSIIEELKLKLV